MLTHYRFINTRHCQIVFLYTGITFPHLELKDHNIGYEKCKETYYQHFTPVYKILLYKCCSNRWVEIRYSITVFAEDSSEQINQTMKPRMANL